MNISVELTLSPLQDDFEGPVIAFIQAMRASVLKVVENPLSTHVYGPYDRVMQLVQTELKEVFESIEHGLLFMKIVKSDRSSYEPHF